MPGISGSSCCWETVIYVTREKTRKILKNALE